MLNRLTRLYNDGQVTKDDLRMAVFKGWITAEEFKNLTGEEYVDIVLTPTYTLDEASEIIAKEVSGYVG